MGVAGHNDPLIGETTCGSLLQQLQVPLSLPMFFCMCAL